MSPDLHKRLTGAEDEHGWMMHRRRLVADMLRPLWGRRTANALDLGCGRGVNLPFLQCYCDEVTGLDICEETITTAKRRFSDYKFVNGDVSELERLFDEQSFDVVTDFSLLSVPTIPSEEDVIRQVYRILKPGGTFVMTEPAFDLLHPLDDRHPAERRRYRLRDLEHMLRMAGFQQVRGTYFNSVAFMPALVGALKERWRAKRNGGEGGEVVPLVVPQASERKKTILRAALNVEHSLIRRLGRLPFGVAILLEARKFA